MALRSNFSPNYNLDPLYGVELNETGAHLPLTTYHHDPNCHDEFYGFSDDSELETEEGEDDFDFEDDDDSFSENIPATLLTFLSMVTNDVRSMVQRNKGNDDFCDVYEERFGSTLSGRELYYADLLELANSNCGRGGKRAAGKSVESGHVYGELNDRHAANGVMGRRSSGHGLGPLEELFKKTPDQNFKHSVEIATTNIPMILRKLPSSFWQEPGLSSKDFVDFTDLFSQWNNDKC